ncbi:MAG: NAD(P)H-hydrate dehydratase [Muribaculaceae bacterium]|nr:NAD(P)H-hydrate dehydratase [Muribaculaceae bacterium]
MRIFPSEALHEIDNATCQAQNIDSLELMERAANAACYEIVARFLPSQRIVVVAGPGNNGGDALATARLLIERGYRHVEIFLFNIKGHLSHDCDEERKKLIVLDDIDFTEVTREFIPPYLGENDVVIDGLFGSGLKEAMQGGFVMLARYINESGAYVISLDIPSGLMGEHNANLIRRDMVHADLTLTFQLPRLSFFFEENADVIGEWKLLDIDLDQDKIKELKSNYMLVEARSVRPLLRPRRPFTGKRDYGSALFFSGSTGMMGAAVLAVRSCLKSGAGLATAHGPYGGLTVMQTAAPEAIFEPDRSEHFISDMSIHHKHQAIAAGPGIGTNEVTIDALEALLKTCEAPLLLDADALNCISLRPALLTMLPRNTVITPHIGEFDRLFGEHKSGEERLAKAIEMAQYYNIIIVLKGHYTVTVRPTGKVFFNSTGNPGMATAGAGDVLTGVIAAFMAQGFKPEHAATVGVYLHGLAGDIAAAELGEYGMTAMDIADRVGRAIKMIIDREELPNSIFA